MRDIRRAWSTADPADIVTADSEAIDHIRRRLAGLMPEWHREALCRDSDPALWFPIRGQSIQPAIDICSRCPVRAECLGEALADQALDYGIRGGLTANARRHQRRTAA